MEESKNKNIDSVFKDQLFEKAKNIGVIQLLPFIFFYFFSFLVLLIILPKNDSGFLQNSGRPKFETLFYIILVLGNSIGFIASIFFIKASKNKNIALFERALLCMIATWLCFIVFLLFSIYNLITL